MANLVLVLICFLVGVAAKRASWLPRDSPRTINAWVLYVSLPALVFRTIHGATLDPRLFAECGALWLVFVVPAALATVYVRRGGSRDLAGVALCAGLGNTAFLGLPLLDALGGKDAVGTGILVDQLGSFAALFVLAVPWATAMRGGTVSLAKTVGQIVRAPALVALTLALLTRAIPLPAVADTVLERLGAMLSPLALASVGWQLDASALRGNGARVGLGLAWKMALAPALVAFALHAIVGPLGPVERVVVVECAMPPMVTAAVVAADQGLAPELAAALVAVGVPIALVTVPAWWHLLG